MSATTQLVPFHGQSLSAVLVDGVPCAAIRPICEALGIDEEGQRQRIKRDPVLNSVACVMKATGADGKRYNMLALPLNKLNGWLFGIDTSRVRPELRERLDRYRAECFDVLAHHFGMAAPSGLADLQARLHSAEVAEVASFKRAQACSHGMIARKKDKRRLQATIAELQQPVQLVLALTDGGAYA